jgi:hypothetical protein
MMRGSIVVVILAACAVAWGAEGGPKVARAVVCSGVEHDEPVGTANAFPADVARVYCFVELTGASDDTTLSTVWYFEGSEMARIGMVAKPPDWRTWGFKRMSSAWVGSWRVVVEDGNGHQLAEVKFKLRKP